MKRILFLSLLCFLMACSKKDVSLVKKGASAASVKATIGNPDEVVQMPMNIEWWKYGSNQMIIMEDGKAINIITDVKADNAEMGNVVDSSFNAIDNLIKSQSDSTNLYQDTTQVK